MSSIISLKTVESTGMAETFCFVYVPCHYSLFRPLLWPKFCNFAKYSKNVLFLLELPGFKDTRFLFVEYQISRGVGDKSKVIQILALRILLQLHFFRDKPTGPRVCWSEHNKIDCWKIYLRLLLFCFSRGRGDRIFYLVLLTVSLAILWPFTFS